jgi:hypothetical protein
MANKTVALAAFLSLFASGCVLTRGGNGPQWVGKHASALVAHSGMPDRELKSPAGSEVYIYRAMSLNGRNELCQVQYYVRGGVIVGYAERGEALNCSGRVGEVR